MVFLQKLTQDEGDIGLICFLLFLRVFEPHKKKLWPLDSAVTCGFVLILAGKMNI